MSSRLSTTILLATLCSSYLVISCKARNSDAKLQEFARHPSSQNNVGLLLSTTKMVSPTRPEKEHDFGMYVEKYLDFATRNGFRTSFDPTRHTNRSKEQIIDMVTDAAKKVGNDGTLLLVVNGHGSSRTGSISTKTGYLALKEILDAISNGRKTFKNQKAARAIIIFDSCYSAKAFKEANLDKRQLPFEQAILISSAGVDQRAADGTLISRMLKLFDQGGQDLTVKQYLDQLKAHDPYIREDDGSIYKEDDKVTDRRANAQYYVFGDTDLNRPLLLPNEKGFQQDGLLWLWEYYNVRNNPTKEHRVMIEPHRHPFQATVVSGSLKGKTITLYNIPYTWARYFFGFVGCLKTYIKQRSLQDKPDNDLYVIGKYGPCDASHTQTNYDYPSSLKTYLRNLQIYKKNNIPLTMPMDTLRGHLYITPDGYNDNVPFQWNAEDLSVELKPFRIKAEFLRHILAEIKKGERQPIFACLQGKNVYYLVKNQQTNYYDFLEFRPDKTIRRFVHKEYIEDKGKFAIEAVGAEGGKMKLEVNLEKSQVLLNGKQTGRLQ